MFNSGIYVLALPAVVLIFFGTVPDTMFRELCSFMAHFILVLEYSLHDRTNLDDVLYVCN